MQFHSRFISIAAGLIPVWRENQTPTAAIEIELSGNWNQSWR